MLINIKHNTLDRLAKELKNKYNNGDNKASLKDLKILIECYVNQDYNLVHNTKLYNLYGGLYCSFLELLNDLDMSLNSSDITI